MINNLTPENEELIKERLELLVRNAQDDLQEENAVVAIPNFITTKFIGYCSMKRDLDLALQLLESLKQSSNDLHRMSFMYTTITLYAKSFNDASSNYPRLSARSIFEEGTEFFKTHEYIQNLRDKLLAHRSKTPHEVGVAFLVVPKEGDIETSRIQYKGAKKVQFLDSEVERAEALIHCVIAYVSKKIVQTAEDVHGGFHNFVERAAKEMGVDNSVIYKFLLINGVK